MLLTILSDLRKDGESHFGQVLLLGFKFYEETGEGRLDVSAHIPEATKTKGVVHSESDRREVESFVR